MARGKGKPNIEARKKAQKAAKESRQRLVNKFREETRDKFFKGREDVSDDRLDRRRQQDLAEQRFIRTRMKPVEGSSNLLQKRDPEGIDLAEFRRRNAMRYGPTFREIGSDIGYGLGSIAKGFAEKGSPLISLIKGLYQKGVDFFNPTGGVENLVPRPDPFSSGADAMGGAFVGPTFNDQKINTQSLDSVFPTPPSEMSNEEFDKAYPFLPERNVNLDNLPFKAKPNVSNQNNFQNSLANARADNVGINLIGQLQNLQNLAQQYNLDKIQFDPFNPNRIGYADQFMFNNTPINYNVGIGDQGIQGGLSFTFKKGGSVDKHSGLGYKLK